ncbi:hypothetical protein DFR70_104641 [Nocardia tenerifensis]|uniref:Uncharacterized protein n=1 Tax=Nocardia tenerifensis TaxID=228006 RepID=A0A318K800_9NOCA|nr:hypothetical protein [Nocardia tenerifensis]PXX65576.1 hypothetical protein DFR70_104641 [Nocardia tenerifensis]
MGHSQKLIGPMSLVWTVGVAVAAVAFMAGVLNVGAAIARWTGSQVAMALFLPISVLLGVGAWMLVLAAAWRLRRKFLRRNGSEVTAVVVESDLRRKYGRSLLNFDVWRVTVEAEFPHPDSGAQARVRKQYFYPQYRELEARALTERLSVGSSIAVVVQGNSALLDVPKRPIWADIW